MVEGAEMCPRASSLRPTTCWLSWLRTSMCRAPRVSPNRYLDPSGSTRPTACTRKTSALPCTLLVIPQLLPYNNAQEQGAPLFGGEPKADDGAGLGWAMPAGTVKVRNGLETHQQLYMEDHGVVTMAGHCR